MSFDGCYTKMVEPEFTAEMESALDDVAAGNNSGKGLINWNETYRRWMAYRSWELGQVLLQALVELQVVADKQR